MKTLDSDITHNKKERINKRKVRKSKNARSFHPKEQEIHREAILRKILKGATCSPLLLKPGLLLDRAKPYPRAFPVLWSYASLPAMNRTCSLIMSSLKRASYRTLEKGSGKQIQQSAHC